MLWLLINSVVFSPAVLAQNVALQNLLLPHSLQHVHKSGAYVLEKGEEALLARAWLSGNTQHSIDIQYFIWGNDNIGTLATEALLNAADKGVRVRVIVDDLLVDADDLTLLAFSAHPNIDIKIYNPQHTVGISFFQRLINLLSGFRKANQRMHDKVVLYDEQLAIVGGRNMADEYFDYDHEYNFRDRDVLLAGAVTQQIKDSFQSFWDSPLSVSVNTLLEKRNAAITDQQVKLIYKNLHEYANNPENFAPHIRQVLLDMTPSMQAILKNLRWSEVRFIHDVPGKNTADNFQGGGQSTLSLVETVQQTHHSLTIQSPYLILPEGGEKLFQDLINGGVNIRINTNSLSSTDNLYAFSGYLNQRAKLLQLGINLFEYKPYPAVQKQLFNRYQTADKILPIFAIHAKTMVIDSQTLFIGTFNLDPRSANLNTEVGALINDPVLAQQVEHQIEIDMQPENSWNAKTDYPDSHAPFFKRIQAFLFSLLPLDPLL